MHRIVCYILVFGFCFLSVCTAGIAEKSAGKEELCFPKLPKEYKKLQKTINKIEKNTQDNYLYILSVYNAAYPMDTTAKTWKNLSAVIQKAAAEIAYAESRDSTYCPAVAEIYQLQGIALFYQKQYQLAYKAFETIVNEHANSELAVESLLWLARASIHLRAYEETEFFLAEIEKQMDTARKDVLVHFHNVAAEYYIQVSDYKSALEHLSESVNIGSPLNTRLSFIAAQIAEELKLYHHAFSYYHAVYQDYNKLQHKFFPNKLMKSYAFVHRHLCEKIIERQYFDSIAEEQWKEYHLVPEDFEPTIVESYHDSSFFERNYPYYFNDYAAMFFLNEYVDEVWNEDGEDSAYFDDEYGDDAPELDDETLESIFDNWESVAIHIPKTDFTHMKDTIYLPLLDTASQYELPYFGSVVSRFGWRRYRYHYGTDLKGSTGDSIYCIFDGVVRIAVRSKTYGNVVIVRHYNGLETFYAHCSKLLVTPNQEVKSGEVIGLIGNTGRSRGAHLHFESRYKGSAFNPEYMIDFANKRLISDTLVLTKETFNYKNTYSTSSSGSSGTKYHYVKLGETLSVIARKYKTSVSNLQKMNGLKSDFIREGQRLRVP
ncbi:MAG: peptidoglycan DD-metalloendopeptidase family protein [Lentimicrobiaceae bacterium]|nr:peptidoglycan DD-metalloendopeptidase family protein [Lentimicrobiaceae bacterium]